MVEVTLIPRIASARLAAGARKSPIRLFEAVTVVPPDKRVPLTAGEVVEIAPLASRSQILFLKTFTVVPLLTDTPFTTGEVAPELESPLIVLLLTFWVVPPVIAIPTTVEDAPEEESPLIVLLKKF